MAMTHAIRRRWLVGSAGALVLSVAGLALFRGGAVPHHPSDGPEQSQASTNAATQAYANLEQQVRRRPRDARAWVLKARADMAAGRHELAAQGYAEAVKVGPKVANDATVWVEYAEARGMTQGGALTGQPLALLERALALNPTHPQALDLAGSAAWETQDYKTAIHYWQRLQQQLPSGDPRQSALQAAVESAQRRARFSLPARIDAGQP
jgi:cytochrome c-type biogenesis protein CcmH